jgi:hypothetical protein
MTRHERFVAELRCKELLDDIDTIWQIRNVLSVLHWAATTSMS